MHESWPKDVKVEAKIETTVGVDSESTTSTEYAIKQRVLEVHSLAKIILED